MSDFGQIGLPQFGCRRKFLFSGLGAAAMTQLSARAIGKEGVARVSPEAPFLSIPAPGLPPSKFHFNQVVLTPPLEDEQGDLMGVGNRATVIGLMFNPSEEERGWHYLIRWSHAPGELSIVGMVDAEYWPENQLEAWVG